MCSRVDSPTVLISAQIRRPSGWGCGLTKPLRYAKRVSALAFILLVSACDDTPEPAGPAASGKIKKAEDVISAFYTFEPNELAPLLSNASQSAPALLFYQGWAKGGNYKILKRHPCVMGTMAPTSVSTATCSITVDDDLVLALKRAHKVTDTFTIQFTEGNIISVETSSDDEPIYREAFDWVVKTSPELMNEECAGFFDGGPTPAACARAMADGYLRFMAQ